MPPLPRAVICSLGLPLYLTCRMIHGGPPGCLDQSLMKTGRARSPGIQECARARFLWGTLFMLTLVEVDYSVVIYSEGWTMVIKK